MHFLYVRNNRTDPDGTDGRGQNTVILDKGEYLITSTLTDNSQSHLGFSIIGAGEFATQITFENDTDPLFNFNSYINRFHQSPSFYRIGTCLN